MKNLFSFYKYFSTFFWNFSSVTPIPYDTAVNLSWLERLHVLTRYIWVIPWSSFPFKMLGFVWYRRFMRLLYHYELNVLYRCQIMFWTEGDSNLQSGNQYFKILKLICSVNYLIYIFMGESTFLNLFVTKWW